MLASILLFSTTTATAADFSWVPGNWGSSDRPLPWGPFTGELRIDTAAHYEFSNPKDNTISGSSEVFRHGELQVTARERSLFLRSPRRDATGRQSRLARLDGRGLGT